MRLTCLILGLVLTGASAEAHAETRSLGIVAGEPGASETELAADMASLFTSGASLRALPMLGDLGAGNIALLLNEPSVDIAFVSADALAAASAAQGAALAEKLELVARLYPQEVHVLARTEIKTVAELAGKRVSVGPEGSGSAATAAALFMALGVEVEPLGLDAATSIARLKQGTIAAAVLVAGKPMPLLGGVPPTPGLHLLPIPFGGAVEASYLPTRLGHAEYPALIKQGTMVQTVATGLVLLAAKAKRDAGSAKRVAEFIDTVFPRFAELKARDRHPKWREINLAASWPGLTKARAAQAWLARQQTKSAATTAAPLPGEAQGLGNNEREALFKQFMEWQRAKGH